MAKAKYYYSKEGKRISKQEFERRQKISRSLKTRNQEKKREALKRYSGRTAPRTSKQPPRRARKTSVTSFTVKRKRSKVKSFPKKGSKNFYYAEKRYYELDVPILIDNPATAREALEKIEEIRAPLIEDFSKKKIKHRLINIGYDISITFQSKDRNPKKAVTIEKPCYVPSFEASDSRGADAAITELKKDIQDRFQKYFTKTGFDGLAIFGFETEISNKGIF